MQRYCALHAGAMHVLSLASAKRQFSARALDRIARVARTIADLADVDAIQSEHVAEAIAVSQFGARRLRGLRGNRSGRRACHAGEQARVPFSLRCSLRWPQIRGRGKQPSKTNSAILVRASRTGARCGAAREIGRALLIGVIATAVSDCSQSASIAPVYGASVPVTAKSQALLYVSTYYGYLKMYTFPQGKTAGSISISGVPEELCSRIRPVTFSSPGATGRSSPSTRMAGLNLLPRFPIITTPTAVPSTPRRET